jgi:hypothetical protein
VCELEMHVVGPAGYSNIQCGLATPPYDCAVLFSTQTSREIKLVRFQSDAVLKTDDSEGSLQPRVEIAYSPLPQLIQHNKKAVPFVLDYNAYVTVDMANSSHLFAANVLVAQVYNSTGLRLPVVPLGSAFHAGYYIAVGTLDEAAIAALATADGRVLPAPPTAPAERALFDVDGYRLDVRGQGGEKGKMGTLILGASVAGAFYGCQ